MKREDSEKFISLLERYKIIYHVSTPYSVSNTLLIPLGIRGSLVSPHTKRIRINRNNISITFPFPLPLLILSYNVFFYSG